MNTQKEKRHETLTKDEAKDYIADMLVSLAGIAEKAQIVDVDSLLRGFSKIIRKKEDKSSLS